MNRENIQSSNLKSVGYDYIHSVLEIEFQSGSIYQYFDVPETIFDSIMKATSAGKYFNQNIAHNFYYQLLSSKSNYGYANTKIDPINNLKDIQVYRSLVKIFHPDKKSGSENMMKLINNLKDENNYYEMKKIAKKFGIMQS